MPEIDYLIQTAVFIFFGLIGLIVMALAGISLFFRAGTGALRFFRLIFRLAVMASSAAISLCFLSLLIDNPASTHLLKVVDDYVLIHLIRWVLLFLVFPLIQVPLLLRSSSGAGGPLAIDAGLAVLHVGSVFLIQILGFLFHGGL